MRNDLGCDCLRICDLRQKEVINLRDGERVGFVGDIEFNLKSGCIERIIIPGPCKIWGVLGRDREYIIPWRCVCRIGCDIILVDVDLCQVTSKCESPI